MDYSVGVGDKLGDVRNRKRCSILEEKRNQTCPFSESSIKIGLNFDEEQIFKIKEFREIF